MKTNPLFLLLILIGTSFRSFAQDPNFHIYLAFGQSNMEGHGTIEQQDIKPRKRFKILQAVNCPDEGKKAGKWIKATPPLCQCGTGLSPVDYFGRTLTDSLPDSIRIGVIHVAVGGCDIRLFDKDMYQDYDSTYPQGWFLNKVARYGGNPYKHLTDLAKQAQKDGVVKGFLLHQGETNTGDDMWPFYVKDIYKDLCKDLALDKKTTPLLAGEVVHEDQRGKCARMNEIIDLLPNTLKNAHVISSKGCEVKPDLVHFNSEGNRELGRRYAYKMLEVLNE